MPPSGPRPRRQVQDDQVPETAVKRRQALSAAIGAESGPRESLESRSVSGAHTGEVGRSCDRLLKPFVGGILGILAIVLLILAGCASAVATPSGASASAAMGQSVPPAHDPPRGSELSDLTGLSWWGRFLSSVVASYMIIIVSEIGDKTFFIAAVLAMNRGGWITFGGAGSALVVMTVLSSCMGRVLPVLLDPSYTHAASVLLFLFFGLKLLWEGYQMKSTGGGVMDEFREVEHELAATNPNKELLDSEDIEKLPLDLRASDITVSSRSLIRWLPARCPWVNDYHKLVSEMLRSLRGCLSSGFVEAFSLTFAAEWGDRSQIATFALGASKNIWGVNLGAITGHLTCTILAVLGGRLLAKRISERMMTLCGGVTFLFFSLAGWLLEYYNATIGGSGEIDPAAMAKGQVSS